MMTAQVRTAVDSGGREVLTNRAGTDVEQSKGGDGLSHEGKVGEVAVLDEVPGRGGSDGAARAGEERMRSVGARERLGGGRHGFVPSHETKVGLRSGGQSGLGVGGEDGRPCEE